MFLDEAEKSCMGDDYNVNEQYCSLELRTALYYRL